MFETNCIMVFRLFDSLIGILTKHRFFRGDGKDYSSYRIVIIISALLSTEINHISSLSEGNHIRNAKPLGNRIDEDRNNKSHEKSDKCANNNKFEISRKFWIEFNYVTNCHV